MNLREIKRENEALKFVFVEDAGAEQTRALGLKELRLSCACAVCRELKVPLNESMPFFPRAITAQKLEMVGNYAFAVTWGDGHRSIFALDRLFAQEKVA